MCLYCMWASIILFVKMFEEPDRKFWANVTHTSRATQRTRSSNAPSKLIVTRECTLLDIGAGNIHLQLSSSFQTTVRRHEMV